MTSSSSSRITIPYGKYVDGTLDKPQRFDTITHFTDRQNAAVVFGAILAHYDGTESVMLLEVDEFVRGHPTPHWRLCVYGLTSAPSRDEIRMLMQEMDPVKPIGIVFEPSRQSHTLFRGDFLTHALCVLMPSMVTPPALTSRAPDITEMILSEKVESWPTMRRAETPAEEKRAKISSSILRRSSSSSSSVKKTRVDRLTRARQRFENRSLLGVWADFVAGVKWEDVAREIGSSASEEQSSCDEDDLH